MKSGLPSGVTGRESGVALIMVIVVLAGLLVIASPFLTVSIQQEAASVPPLEEARAHMQVDSTLRYVRYVLEEGHALRERERAGGERDLEPRTTPYMSPDVDTPEEMDPPKELLDRKGQPLLAPAGVPLRPGPDPRGTTTDFQVDDDHARPNLLGSPPFLIAASLGRAPLAVDLERDETGRLVLDLDEDALLPPKDGRLLVGGEVIGYSERTGGVCTGLSRGLEGGTRPRQHLAETMVIDDRARLIAMLPWKSPRAAGGYREPLLTSYVKEIALLGEATLSPIEVDRLLRDFSTSGRRFAAGTFGAARQVLGVIDPANYEGNGFTIRVGSTEGFNPGTVVRITDGTNTDYGMVLETTGRLVLHEPPTNAYDDGTATVAPLLRHPVNVNTASKDTLERILFGIQGGFGGRARGAQGRLDDAATTMVVEALAAARPIRDLRHLREVLGSLAQSQEILFNDILASTVFRNAVDSLDSNLALSTVPFAFRSFDHYTVTAQAYLNDQSGRRLATRSVRERVRVAPPGVQTLLFDTQEELDAPFLRSRLGRYTTTHPLPVERWAGQDAAPASRIPRMLYNFGLIGGLMNQGEGEDGGDDLDRSGESGLFPSRERGDVRLAPSRVSERSGRRGSYVQHFDGPGFLVQDDGIPLERVDPEGYRLVNGPFELDPREGRRGASLSGREGLNPLRLDFWYRTGRGGGGSQVLFDHATSTADGERVQLALEGSTLVARLTDRTLDDPGDGLEETIEVRWEPENAGFWQPETWYHVGMAWRATKPDDVSLWVDGFPRGEKRYLTRLAGNLAPDGGFFQVEDATGWPDRGVTWVGDEVIAFERNGESFEVQDLPNAVPEPGRIPWGRGARGTRPRAHAAGAEVRLYGYSLLPRGADRRTNTPVIPSGGGTLRSSLGPMMVGVVAPSETRNISWTERGRTFQAEIGYLSANSATLQLFNADSLAEGDVSCFPETGGYVVIVSRGVPSGSAGLPSAAASAIQAQIPECTDLLQPKIEIAYYQGRNGFQLYGLSPATAIPDSQRLTNVIDQNTGLQRFDLIRRCHVTNINGSGIPPLINLCAVFPISIPVSDVSGYREPERVRNPDGSFSQSLNNVTYEYPDFHTEPEFVQVGRADALDLATNRVEWIRYHHRDEANGHLLCDEGRDILFVADVIRVLYCGLDVWPESSRMIQTLFPFRLQCETDDLTDGTHAASVPVVPCLRTFTPARRSAINNPNWSQQFQDAPVSVGRASPAGWGDKVTIEANRGRTRINATVAWAGEDEVDGVWSPPPTFLDPNGDPLPDFTWRRHRNYEGQGWIAFTESLGQSFRQRNVPQNGEDRQRDTYLRLLKFPSGELPDLGREALATVGGDVYGTVADAGALIDELRITEFESERYVLWDHDAMNLGADATSGGTRESGIGANADELPIANVRWLVSTPFAYGASPRFYVLPDGRKIHYEEEIRGLRSGLAGVAQIGNELVAFRDVGQGQHGGPALLGCERGFLGSLAVEHSYGTPVVVLDFATVAKLRDPLDARSETVVVDNPRGFDPEGGLLLIDQELIHYTEFGNGGLFMPRRIGPEGDYEGGLFRGRFGTTPSGHDVESMVVQMPFRYWDRYAPRSDSGQLGWYGLSLDRKDAWFHEVTVDWYQQKEHTGLELIVRTDPSVSWAADPEKTPGLYRFQDPDPEDVLSLGVSGEGLEIRVLFPYRAGSFDAFTMDRHAWKSTPVLESLGARFLERTRVLSREVLR